eukprot:GEMP01074797.1.p1 GENE.GEMP01074797.1~~GEMP01074797.1.p1  ORF type:complete len:280 (+),score=53.10 GEMP01074797.1:22-840(+)
MAASRVLAVTGANRGIGFETVKLLAQRETNATIALLARNTQAGNEAVAKLHAEGLKNIQFVQCEISSDDSVDSMVKSLQSIGNCQLFVNNAGFAYKNAATEPFPVQARDSIDANYYGTRRVCLKVLAAFPSARVVNVASMAGAGAASKLSDERRQGIFESAEKLYANVGDNEVTAFMESFVAKSGDEDNGYAKTAYGMSKLGVIMMTEVLGRQHEISSCSPGWCKSDLAGYEKPPLTAADGAGRVVDLCYKNPFVRGGFFREMQLGAPYGAA